jgi:hypothetical protein
MLTPKSLGLNLLARHRNYLCGMKYKAQRLINDDKNLTTMANTKSGAQKVTRLRITNDMAQAESWGLIDSKVSWQD